MVERVEAQCDGCPPSAVFAHIDCVEGVEGQGGRAVGHRAVFPNVVMEEPQLLAVLVADSWHAAHIVFVHLAHCHLVVTTTNYLRKIQEQKFLFGEISTIR